MTSLSVEGYDRVGTLLQEPLWRDRDAYDAAHALMVPLHFAYARGDDRRLNEFGDFFRRFQADHQTLISERLGRLQFLWLASRFSVLESRVHECGQFQRDLMSYLQSEVLRIMDEPAWSWDVPDFPTLLLRVRWKLANRSVGLSYYRAIIDEDLFALAVASDLRFARRNCDLGDHPMLAEAANLAREVFQSEVVSTGTGGWVFQPGVWTDHPDFQYAGHSQVLPSLQPRPVPGIAPDASHSFRLPLLLLSFKCAGDLTNERFFESLREGLMTQWRSVVVVAPTEAFPAVRMTNFMDGANGVYRYGYVTQGQGRGFGPFELSGSFNLGWWSFLGSRAQEFYELQRDALPFRSPVIAAYVGPNTTRDRNPAFREPEFYDGPLIAHILDAAATLGEGVTRCT